MAAQDATRHAPPSSRPITSVQLRERSNRPARGQESERLNPTRAKCRCSSPQPPCRRCRRCWPRRPEPASGSRLPLPPPPLPRMGPLPAAPAPAASRRSFPERWSASATAPPSAWPSESSGCPSRRADFFGFRYFLDNDILPFGGKFLYSVVSALYIALFL